MDQVIFPKWINKLVVLLLLGGPPGAIYVVVMITFGLSPKTFAVGYQPEQPVPFSHALHAGELGMDCRYCHNTVEEAAHAAIPPTSTCMNCHKTVKAGSEKLAKVWDSHETGKPIEWVRVNDLPQYVFFNHSAHVNAGVSCVSCHGRVDKMEKVYQHEPLSMGWCLRCHNDPAKHIRPKDKVTDLNWTTAEPRKTGEALMKKHNINPSTDCSVCHR